MTTNSNLFNPPAPPPPPPIIKIETNPPKPHSNPQQDLDLALQRLLNSNQNLKFVFHLSNIDLQPQIQDGPKCGLVALSIASTIRPVPTDVKEIYQKALTLAYTKQGEIFRAEFLADLAEKCCGFSTKIITGGLYPHLRCIITHLLNKNLLLIPYDADRNHQPCCKKGFKSHWAVITGVAILSDSSDTDSLTLDQPAKPCNCIHEPHSQTPLRIYSFDNSLILANTELDNSTFQKTTKTKGKLYLISRQGKSRHVALWPFEQISESNDNLMFLCPDRDRKEYVVPVGGPAEGLKGKAIVLQSQPLHLN